MNLLLVILRFLCGFPPSRDSQLQLVPVPVTVITAVRCAPVFAA